ncbi:hypothetical protein FJZ55_06265 [Candidatus Woesearchaeota archaeon]|nr:hypothetical protein [Candidatus Woesearchaeota archaeon]
MPSWEEYRKQQKDLRAKFTGSGGGKGFKGTKGSAPQAWMLRAKYFAPGERPTRVRLIPTSPQDPFHLYYNKWWENKVTNKRAPVISNSRNGELEVPDLVFYYASAQDNPQLLAVPTYAITVLILETFHKVERRSAKNTAYFDFVRCAGLDRYGKVACDMCRQNVETVFGQQRYWSMSNMSKDELMDELNGLTHRCANCGVGELQTYAYECAKCGKEIANRYNDTELTDGDVAVLDNEAVECQHCGETTPARKLYECMTRVGTGYKEGCSKPTKAPATATPFDYDITLVGEKTANITKPTITAFAPARTYEIPGYMLQPMPFTSFLSYMTLEEQSRALGLPNPFDSAAEKALTDYFASKSAPTPSAASAGEADPDSIPWGNKK